MIVAMYPGSFDPITYGHLDIIERGSRVFDRIIVAVLNNRTKVPLFSIEERVALIRKVTNGIPNLEVDSFEGLLVDFVRKKQANVIVRGLRAVSDFEYELQNASMNKKLNPDVETFFMMTNNNFSYLSSSIIKEVAKYGGDVSDVVPPAIDQELRKKYLDGKII